MKTALSLAMIFVLPVCAFSAGSQSIIYQRAKDLRDQNNARQGVPPPAQAPNPNPSQPVQPAAPTTITLTPQQQALLRLQSAMSAIRPGHATVAPELKQQLATAMAAVARGSIKPSISTLARVSESLSGALSQKLLADVTRKRLAQNLDAVINSGSLPAPQLKDIIADTGNLFEKAGVDKPIITSLQNNLKSVADEVSPKLAK